MGVYLSGQISEKQRMAKESVLLLSRREEGLNAGRLREIGLENTEASLAAHSDTTNALI